MLIKGLAPPAGQNAVAALQQLQDLRLPFGWDPAAVQYFSDPLTGVSEIVGWFIMAGSTLFGAAFWFDALQRIAQLRGAGSK
jgi:hypothetical protein